MKFLGVCVSIFYILQSVCVLSSPDRVLLGFYAESLCPDCTAFSNGPLTEAIDQIPTIFTLEYIPWGNAKLSSAGDFKCQHGNMECIMNTVEACALNYYPNISTFWPFLHCLDGYSTEKTPDIAKECAMKAKMDWTLIDSCRSGPLGHKLELGYANKTMSLQPPHKYTPWITINGKHTPNAEGPGLIKAICDAFKGQYEPYACRSN